MKLDRGINLGGYLSQCPHQLMHYENFITENDISIIAEAGFDHVRLPVDYNVWETEDGRKNISGYALTDRVIDWCKKYSLGLILDLHKAKGYDFGDANNAEKNNLFTSSELQERYINLWGRTAERYASLTNVAFELLNEVVEESNAEAWNDLIDRTVAEIRRHAPNTPIIYGGIQYNNVLQLKNLRKPADKNIIFTFHFYSPMPFTHQKAPWCAGIDQKATANYPDNSKEWNAAFARKMVQEGVKVAKEAGVQLYCGEYGVILNAPLLDTIRWFKDVDDVFREFNIGCAVWTYKEMAFGIFDKVRLPIRRDLLKIWIH